MDRLWRIFRGKEGDEPPLAVPWAQRLMQLQVATVYLGAFLSKAGGEKWANGTAAYYPLHLPETVRFPMLGSDVLWVINLITWGTIAVELALATLVWVPRLRLYVLAAGVMLHLGIEYSMNIPLFSFMMIVSYVTFLTAADFQNFLAWAKTPLRLTPLRLVYDGECDFCKSALLAVRFLDVFRQVTFIDAHDAAAREEAGVRMTDAEQAAIAVNPTGRQFAGFDAFRALAWQLPATTLFAPAALHSAYSPLGPPRLCLDKRQPRPPARRAAIQSHAARRGAGNTGRLRRFFMPTAEPKRRMSRGECALCGQEFSKNTIARHVDKCWAEMAAKEKHDERSLQPTKFFRLVIEGRDLPEYWLHLDVRTDATLEDLDDFLRRFWLECCGHLSAFTIGETRYRWEPPGGFDDDDFFDRLDGVFGMPREYRMDVTLAQTLSVGTTFYYEYDFGSTTELKLRVLSEHEEPTRCKNIRILARNEPPLISCEECGEEADWIGAYDKSYEIKSVCDTCIKAKGYSDEHLLPVVNSPRTGVCGYEG